MRHGGLHVVRQTFKGFTALPAPPGKKNWREVLQIKAANVTPAEVDAAYRSLAQAAHPDSGGSNEKMAQLNAARKEAKEAISA
jgi:DnaJ-class molecular chaperone